VNVETETSPSSVPRLVHRLAPSLDQIQIAILAVLGLEDGSREDDVLRFSRGECGAHSIAEGEAGSDDVEVPGERRVFRRCT
jgi:hypothetical protein